jgi:hypothetical protein
LAFGGIGDPAVEVGEEFTGMKLLAGAGDGIGSGHVFLSRPRTSAGSGLPGGLQMVRDKNNRRPCIAIAAGVKPVSATRRRLIVARLLSAELPPALQAQN